MAVASAGPYASLHCVPVCKNVYTFFLFLSRFLAFLTVLEFFFFDVFISMIYIYIYFTYFIF